MKLIKFKNNNKKIFDKAYSLLRKRCEQKIGVRYNNFWGLENAVNDLWCLKKIISSKELILAIDRLFDNDEIALADIFKKGLDEALKARKTRKASKICCHLGAIYSFISNEQAIKFYQQAIDLNPKNLEAYVLCGLLYVNDEKHCNALEFLEKIFDKEFLPTIFNIKSLIGFSKKQKLTALAYSGLANVAIHQGDLQEATIRLFFALKFFEKNNMPSEVAGSYQKLGIIYRITGNTDQAEEMHQTALKIYQELDWQENIADSYGNLGMTMGVREDLDSALEYHRKALEINENIGRKSAIASQYENIGITYHMKQQLFLAEKNLQKALDLFVSQNNRSAMARNCENLGAVYEKSKNIEHAVYINFQALRIYQEVADLKGQAECHSNLGRLMYKSNDFEQSIKHFNNAINIEKKLNINNVLSTTLNNLGLLYLDKNNLKFAEKNFKEALNLELQTRRIISIGAIYNNLSKVENLKNNQSKAEEYQQKSQEYFAEIEGAKYFI